MVIRSGNARNTWGAKKEEVFQIDLASRNVLTSEPI